MELITLSAGIFYMYSLITQSLPPRIKVCRLPLTLVFPPTVMSSSSASTLRKPTMFHSVFLRFFAPRRPCWQCGYLPASLFSHYTNIPYCPFFSDVLLQTPTHPQRSSSHRCPHWHRCIFGSDDRESYPWQDSHCCRRQA